MRLGPDDHARVTEAIRAAEAHTAGEIVPVVAAQSDAYHDAALHWNVLAMFGVVALLAALPGHGIALLDPVIDRWGGGPNYGELLTALLVLLATVYLVVHFLTKPTAMRMALTPGATKTRRVRRQALALFRVGAEKRTTGRTGVLIYLSVAERRAEIIADAAIHGRVAPDVWGAAMASLLAGVRDGRPGDGLVAAIGQVGEVLAEHFPRQADDVNELPDRLVEP